MPRREDLYAGHTTVHPLRRSTALGTAAAIGLVTLLSGWALLAPAPDVLQAPDHTLVAAEHGAVERSLRLNTSAQWSPESIVAGRAVGTVTKATGSVRNHDAC